MKYALIFLLVLATSSLANDPALADTPAARLSQQRTVTKYPDIGVPGSPLNRAFLDVIVHWKTWKPDQLQRDTWPELVAEEALKVAKARRYQTNQNNRLGK